MTINDREPYAIDDAKRKKRKGGFFRNIPGVKAALTFCIATTEGLIITSALPYRVDETKVATVSTEFI
jgi:hypothetical protein